MTLNTLYRTVGLFTIAIAFFISCEMQKDTEGSGVVILQRRSVLPFERIHIDGVLTVYIQQGANYRVEVETDDNLQNLISAETINGTLYIETDPDEDFDATKLNVFISTPELTDLILRGVTALYCNNRFTLTDLFVDKSNTGVLILDIDLDNLYIDSDDVGDMELSGIGNYAKINNSAIGNIYAYNFKVADMLLNHDGTGDVQIYVANSLVVNLTGVGDVYCKGYPPSVAKTTEGVGRLYMVD